MNEDLKELLRSLKTHNVEFVVSALHALTAK